MERNDCWMCGLVPIGKKDYRGSLSSKLICLEEEKEASLMTPTYKRYRNRSGVNEKEMDLHQKEIEVCF